MYSQKGFSLVELLIAIAVLSFVIAGSLMAFQTLLQNTASHTLYTNIGQKADFVLRKMERELKQTGYHYPSNDYNTTPRFDNGLPIKVLHSDEKRVDVCFDRSFENRVVISYNYNPEDHELERAEHEFTLGELQINDNECNSETLDDWEPVIKGVTYFTTSTQAEISKNKNILIEMWLKTKGDTTKKFQTSVNLSNLLIEDGEEIDGEEIDGEEILEP